MSSDIKFGTGGWRAVIGEDFTKENVRRVAAGIARLIHEQGKTDMPVMIGYDRRFFVQRCCQLGSRSTHCV